MVHRNRKVDNKIIISGDGNDVYVSYSRRKQKIISLLTLLEVMVILTVVGVSAIYFICSARGML